MSRVLVTLLIAILLTGILAGCGGNIEETYILTTLREATRGDLLSPGFKYSFDSPKFIAAHKHLALVREGNLIEFFSGHNIESRMAGMMGGKYVVGARKMFNPRIYFTVDWVTAGTDTVIVGENYDVIFPVLLKGTEYPTDDYLEIDLDVLTPNVLKLKPIFNKRFLVGNSKLAYEEVLMPNNETKMAYMLHLKNVRFILEEPNDEIMLILKALINENLYFDGGVSFGGRPTTSRSYRDKTKIGGKVKLEFVRYSRHIVTTG